jgi:hypothetical protein
MRDNDTFWIISGIAMFALVLIIAMFTYAIGYQVGKAEAVRQCVQRKY